MSKAHTVDIEKRLWTDPDEYFSFEAGGEPHKITAIARDNTGDMSLIEITAEQAHKVVDALEAAIEDLETPQVGDMIDSARVLGKLPDGSILRNPETGSAYWRNHGGWFNPSAFIGRSAGNVFSVAGGALELLYVGGSK